MSKKNEGHFSGYFKDVVTSDGWFIDVEDIYIVKVMYNNPATIVFWSDGTKSVSKCHGEDKYNPKIGLYLAVLKRFSKSVGNLYDDWHPDVDRDNKTSVITVKDVRKRNRMKEE